jgi:CheY-like chemotaxis protein
MAGHTVEFTNSVHTTLLRCAEQRFDLVLLDYNITDTEAGWTVASDLRINPNTYGYPKIILISGTVTMNATQELGISKECFDAFLAKPFSLKELDETIRRLMAE